MNHNYSVLNIHFKYCKTIFAIHIIKELLHFFIITYKNMFWSTSEYNVYTPS